MRRIVPVLFRADALFLALLVALLPPGASAQLIVFPRVTQQDVSGTLTTITTDKVTIPLPGSSWATALFSATTAGTATATAQVSIDGGVNFIASAYGKRLSTVNANPTIQAISATTLVANDVWEVPLPANATHFRLLCGGTGTVTTVRLSPGALYAPGVSVAGTLFDVTSAVNTAIDTGTLDLSGWAEASVHYTTPAGGSGTISEVDDAGTSVTIETIPASANSFAMFSTTPVFNVTAVALPAAGFFGTAPLLKRMRFQSAGVAALTSRIRLEVRR